MTLNLSAAAKKKASWHLASGEKNPLISVLIASTDAASLRISRQLGRRGVRAVKVESNAKRAAHEPFGRNRIHAAHAR
jgi:hypothetical protein